MSNISSKNTSANENFLLQLNTRIGRNRDLKTKIAGELGICTSNFYKKLRGDTGFSLDEIGLLAKEFNISVDSCIGIERPGNIVYLPNWKAPVNNAEEYILRLNKLLKEFNRAGNPEISYLTREVPFPYYLIEPDVASFKLFIFSRFVWVNSGFTAGYKYRKDLFSPFIHKKIANLWDGYATIPSLEIWNPNILDNTLQQILFALKNNLFENQHDALSILEKIRNIMRRVRQMALNGIKIPHNNRSKTGKFILLNNSIMHTNNIILLESTDHNNVLLTHDNPNFITSDDADVISYTKKWRQTLIDSSDKISGDNREPLEDFFRVHDNKIDITYRKIITFISKDEEIF